MNIPPVKTWIVTLTNGKKFEVLAPTKMLAILNFRFDWPPCQSGIYIESVGLKRKSA